MIDLAITQRFDFLDFVIKSGILAVCSLAVVRIALGRWSASTRLAFILASFAVLCFLLVLEVSFALEGLSGWRWEQALSIQTIEFTLADVSMTWLHWLSGVWLIGAILFVIVGLLQFTYGEWTCLKHLLKQNASQDSSSVSRQGLGKRVVVTPSCKAPNTQGVFFPTIFLPIDYLGWEQVDQDNVMAHERAHVDRRDVLWSQFGFFCAAMLWFVPPIWMLYHRLQIELEKRCDDAVLSSGVNARSYCETLVNVCAEQKSNVLSGAQMSLGSEQKSRGLVQGWLASSKWLGSNWWLHESALHQRVLAAIDPKVSHTGITKFQLGVIVSLALLTSAAFASVEFKATSPGQILERTIELSVANSLDDAEEDIHSGSIDTHSRDLEFHVDPHPNPERDRYQQIGLRFSDLNIPRGATILSAQLEFTCLEPCQDKLELVIESPLQDDSPPFKRSRFDISSRRGDSNSKEPWPILPDDCHADLDHGQGKLKTPDLSALVQSVIDQDGWTKGNAIAFIVSSSNTDTNQRTFCKVATFDHTHGSDPPKLKIRYRGSAY